MKQSTPEIVPARSTAANDELQGYQRLLELRRACPIPENEVMGNLALFLPRASLSRMLFMHELYRKILPVHGVILEFGVRWGQNTALLTTCRGMYEPYNISRKIVGFDTFEGFPGVTAEDGNAKTVATGVLSVTPRYEEYLDGILTAHEQLAPRGHVQRHELVKGDAAVSLPKYLAAHPETVIAMAYFDMDLYAPTKKCLELIRPYLAKNSIVGFDELVSDEYPGETQALREAWGLGNFELIRDPISAHQSYVVMT